MQKKRVILLSTGMVALIGFGFLFFRPSISYDTARVEPRLLSLRKPYQKVTAGYYMDGGSIGMEIVDWDGKKEQFAIPCHLGETNCYDKVFVGAMYDSKPGAVEVKDPEHTKRMLINALQSRPDRTPWEDYCLLKLRKEPVDFARCYIHKWRGAYKY